MVEERKGMEGNEEVGKEDEIEVEVLKIRARNEGNEGEVTR